MTAILRSTENGRVKLSMAKLGVAACFSVVIILTFGATVLLTVWMKSGLSEASVPVQCLYLMRICPYEWSIAEYFWVFAATKCLGFLAFSMLSVLATVLFYRPAVGYLGGGAALVIACLTDRIELPKYPILTVVNFFSVTEVNRFIGSLKTFDLCSYAVLRLNCAIVLSLDVMLISSSASFLLFAFDPFGNCAKATRGPTARLVALGAAAASKIKAVAVKRKNRKAALSAHGIFFWEGYKLSHHTGIMLLTVLFLSAECILSASTYSYAPGKDLNRIYLANVQEYLGEMNEEKATQIKSKYDAAMEVFSRKAETEALYQTGKIDQDEYHKYLQSYAAASGTVVALQEARDKTVYLERKYAETGIWGWLCDTLGFERFFSTGVDLPLHASILLFGAVIFTEEKNGKGKADCFSAILRSTKNGGKRTFWSKYAVSAGFSLGMLLLCTAIRMCFFHRVYSFSADSLQAPLFSITAFEKVGSGITIGQYFAFVMLAKIPTTVLFSAFVTSLSALSENFLSALGSSLMTAIPSALAWIGLPFAAAEHLNLLGWLQVGKFAEHSFTVDLFGADLGLFWLFTVLFALLGCSLTLIARRKFVR